MVVHADDLWLTVTPRHICTDHGAKEVWEVPFDSRDGGFTRSGRVCARSHLFHSQVANYRGNGETMSTQPSHWKFACEKLVTDLLCCYSSLVSLRVPPPPLFRQGHANSTRASAVIRLDECVLVQYWSHAQSRPCSQLPYNGVHIVMHPGTGNRTIWWISSRIFTLHSQ